MRGGEDENASRGTGEFPGEGLLQEEAIRKTSRRRRYTTGPRRMGGDPQGHFRQKEPYRQRCRSRKIWQSGEHSCVAGPQARVRSGR